jgi:hypothetical protein
VASHRLRGGAALSRAGARSAANMRVAAMCFDAAVQLRSASRAAL